MPHTPVQEVLIVLHFGSEIACASASIITSASNIAKASKIAYVSKIADATKSQVQVILLIQLRDTPTKIVTGASQ